MIVVVVVVVVVVGGGGLLEGVLAVADEVADLLARGEDLAVLGLHS
jgi:hypothetical protein